MKLIIGLGNPGKEYRLTRHNVGFTIVDELAKRHGIRVKLNRRFKAGTGEGRIGAENCYLVMPNTFMNLSGHAVRLIVNWLKIDLKDILVIVDDIAIPFGQIRIRPKGSDAGHKGLRSITECLGIDDFPRLRIGIKGREIVKDCSSYVLSSFTQKEQKDLRNIIQRCLAVCECWIAEGIDTVMNRYNERLVND